MTGRLTGIAAFILALLFVATQWPLLVESGFGAIVLLVIVGVFWIGLYGLAIGLYGLVRLVRRRLYKR
ncbi:MAG TPA: hypothetical protein VGX75_01920 [bacterium]|nr:hypothetical protein [bacterium]